MRIIRLVWLSRFIGGLATSQYYCLMGCDLSNFDFLSATRSGFVPVSLKPIGSNRLTNKLN